MSTLGILTVFDSQGVIDKCTIYYAKSLRDAIDDLIIVINGNINLRDLCGLKKISDKIIVRKNVGFDAGGYKDVLEKYGKEFILKYDQVVFSNDTCFGPFVPFKSIFKVMEKRKGDFWGVEYLDNDYQSFIGLFFIVFRKATLSDVFDFFVKLDTDNMIRADVVRIVELGIFQYLISKKYKLTYYSSIENYDKYEAPNYCTKQCGFPVMKKRCFDPLKYHKDNCIDLLKYISENCDYDIQLILESIKRRYSIIYDINNEFSRNLYTEPIKIPHSVALKDIINFAKCNKKVYIYGTGMYGKLLYERLREYVKIDGFVVSDDKYKDQYVYDLKVYFYSDIYIKDCKIIVAIKNCDQLKIKLKDQKNVLYLW